jgi:hypothetical protein
VFDWCPMRRNVVFPVLATALVAIELIVRVADMPYRGEPITDRPFGISIFETGEENLKRVLNREVPLGGDEVSIRNHLSQFNFRCSSFNIPFGQASCEAMICAYTRNTRPYWPLNWLGVRGGEEWIAGIRFYPGLRTVQSRVFGFRTVYTTTRPDYRHWTCRSSR